MRWSQEFTRDEVIEVCRTWCVFLLGNTEFGFKDYSISVKVSSSTCVFAVLWTFVRVVHYVLVDGVYIWYVGHSDAEKKWRLGRVLEVDEMKMEITVVQALSHRVEFCSDPCLYEWIVYCISIYVGSRRNNIMCVSLNSGMCACCFRRWYSRNENGLVGWSLHAVFHSMLFYRMELSHRLLYIQVS